MTKIMSRGVIGIRYIFENTPEEKCTFVSLKTQIPRNMPKISMAAKRGDINDEKVTYKANCTYVSKVSGLA